MDKNKVTKQHDNMMYNKNDSSVSSFISYLIAAFDCKGIKLGYCYGVKLFLVILSKDYASSVSCLESLVKHLELSKRDMDSYEVVPVFYGVSRSTVKQQSGTYRDAFTKLERSYSLDQVTKWRCALAEAAELEGHEYDDVLSEESVFVEDIVEAVFEKLHPTEEIRIRSRQLEIENLLCKQPWGVRTLGIFGKPGIGKTVLSRAIFRQIIGGYDASRFVEDFHTEYSKLRLEPLPDAFFCMTLVEKYDLNDSDSDSESCHRQKRVTIVLDDVRNAQDAKSFLGGDLDQFGPGSLIIITSRDRKVLKQCQMKEIYELKGLKNEDAMKLFTRCAFGKDVIIRKNLLDLSKNVIECCDGNPSTLRSYAEKVKGKTAAEMEHALFRICYDAVINTNKNTSLCFYSNTGENDHEDDERKEYGVLATSEHAKCICLKKTVMAHATQNFIFDIEELLPSNVHHESLISDISVPHLEHSSMQVQSLPHHFHRRQLVLLQRLTSQFLKLWEGYNKSFSRLRSINLGNCEKLVKVVELSNARNLERIDLRDCKNLESIPDTDQLDNLQFLNLSGCTGIRYFPVNVRTIRELNLEGTGIREIRSETTNFSKLIKHQSNTYNFGIYTDTLGVPKI